MVAPIQAQAANDKEQIAPMLVKLQELPEEPVFGIIKSTLGSRQFLLRGLENIKGEWNLVTMSWNLGRMFTLQAT